MQDIIKLSSSVELTTVVSTNNNATLGSFWGETCVYWFNKVNKSQPCNQLYKPSKMEKSCCIAKLDLYH
jgi:hypothetical protein